jgi:hypothetical protein
LKQRVPESGVLRACLDLLAAERIFHVRMNVGAVKDGKRFFRFGRKGMADILAIPRLWVTNQIVDGTLHITHHRFVPVALPLWIEAKASDGQQRPEQAEFQREVEEQGHSYLLVRSSDDLLEWLKAHGIAQ